MEADFDKGSSSSERRGSSSNTAISKGRRPSLLRKSRKKEDHKGLVIPQVQVTGTYSDYHMNVRIASFSNCNTASLISVANFATKKKLPFIKMKIRLYVSL